MSLEHWSMMFLLFCAALRPASVAWALLTTKAARSTAPGVPAPGLEIPLQGEVARATS